MNRIHDVIHLAFGSFTIAVAVLLLVLGMLCFVWGNRFYWLAVGLNVFLISFIAIHTMVVWNDWREFSLAGVLGIFATLLALLFKRYVVGINSFLIFGLLCAGFVNEFISFEDDSFIPIIIFFIVGSFAAFLSFSEQEAAVILTSSIIGAMCISIGIFKLAHLDPKSMTIFILWIGLALASFIWQRLRSLPAEEDRGLSQDEPEYDEV